MQITSEVVPHSEDAERFVTIVSWERAMFSQLQRP